MRLFQRGSAKSRIYKVSLTQQGCAMRSFPAARFGPVAARTLVGFQNLLPDPDGLRRDLDVLVLGDELHRLLEIERPDGDEPNGLVRDRSAHVGLLLLLDRVHVHIVPARVLADHHAPVNLDAGTIWT